MKNLTISPFLTLNGQAEEAIRYYQELFEAELLFKITNREMKAQMDPTLAYPENEADWVAHSVMTFAGQTWMIADIAIDTTMKEFQIGNHFSFCLEVEDRAAAESLYQRFLADSRTQVVEPLAANLFSDGYAIVKCPFGITFQIVSKARPAS
ncbi:VOC family protein [Listeria costaricensis]|uniref:VOC family protein n=1 Tax=Listeria costaricensis TaxID=2026604 RepID=UPI000C068DA9|nr:VOC family protein [Listeria costaricensis]